jgi:hypothetical protein
MKVLFNNSGKLNLTNEIYSKTLARLLEISRKFARIYYEHRAENSKIEFSFFVEFHLELKESEIIDVQIRLLPNYGELGVDSLSSHHLEFKVDIDLIHQKVAAEKPYANIKDIISEIDYRFYESIAEDTVDYFTYYFNNIGLLNLKA